MIRTTIILLMLCVGSFSWAQPLRSLSLEEAYDLFYARYPSLQKEQLLPEKTRLELDLLDKEKRPQVFLKGEGRLQSQSTQLISPNPDFPIQVDQPLVNLKSYLEANYTLLDGGMNDVLKSQKNAEWALEKQSYEVERFALRERINHLFLLIEKLQTQSTLFTYYLADLASKRAFLQARVDLGTALINELQQVEVKVLEIESQEEDNRYRIQGGITVLADLLGVEIDPNVELEFPNLGPATTLPTINRPETALFQKQKELLLTQNEWIEVQQRPKLNAFAQTGIGYPNPLNLLDNSVAPYALVGLGFSWNIVDWKKKESKKSLLSIRARELDLQEETFLFNLEQKTASFQSEYQRIQAQSNKQDQIIEIQEKIEAQLSVQLSEGVLSSAAYITQLNQTLAAKQQKILLEITLQQLQLSFWNDRGAF